MEDELKPVRERVSLLKVPIDIVEPDQLGVLAFHLLLEGKPQNIVLLSLWDLLRARRNAEYREYVKNASLVIPISKSIVSGIRFLLGKRAVRYMPFDFAVNLLTALETSEFSCYLLGGDTKVLLKIEKNINDTFPGLQVVGRVPGSFKKQREPDIIRSICKSAPSILLVGKGIKGGERWIARNNAHLGNGLRMWCSDLFDVFAKRKQHPPQARFELGLEWIDYCLQNPLKVFRIFPYLYFKLLLLVYKLFKTDNSGKTKSGELNPAS